MRSVFGASPVTVFSSRVYRRVPLAFSAMPSKPPEAARLAVACAGQHRCVLGRIDAGQRDRGAQHFALRIGLHQIGAELIAEPEVACAVTAHRLDVEIGAGQQAAAADVCIDQQAWSASP